MIAMAQGEEVTGKTSKKSQRNAIETSPVQFIHSHSLNSVSLSSNDISSRKKEEGKMSSTLLELMRHTYEQSERYEVAIGEELDIKPNGVRIFLFQFRSYFSHPPSFSAKSESVAAT